jgi:hypothetical protein
MSPPKRDGDAAAVKHSMSMNHLADAAKMGTYVAVRTHPPNVS